MCKNFKYELHINFNFFNLLGCENAKISPAKTFLLWGLSKNDSYSAVEIIQTEWTFLREEWWQNSLTAYIQHFYTVTKSEEHDRYGAAGNRQDMQLSVNEIKNNLLMK